MNSQKPTYDELVARLTWAESLLKLLAGVIPPVAAGSLAAPPEAAAGDDQPTADKSGETEPAAAPGFTLQKQSEVRLTVFSRLGRQLIEAQTAVQAARVIATAADDLLGWDACAVDFYSAEADQLTSIISIDVIDGRRTELPGDGVRPASPLAQRILAEGALLLLRCKPGDFERDLEPFGNLEQRVQSLMFVPVRHARQTSAFLTIQSYSPNAYNEADLELLQSLADHCGGALERIQAQEALRESEQRFRALIENSSDAVALLNAQGTFLYQSPAASRTLGYSNQESIGHSLFEYMHPYDAEERRPAFAEMVQRAGARTFSQFRLRHKSGAWRWLECAGVNMLDQPSIGAVVLNYRDVTERKVAEQNLQTRVQQQAAVAYLGQYALANSDLEVVIAEAMRLLTERLDVQFCKLLDIDEDSGGLRWRAGRGWRYDRQPDLVGGANEVAGYGMGAYTLQVNTPVILLDLATETRFAALPLLYEHGVVSGLMVVLHGHERPLGVLGTYTSEQHRFTEDDIHFVQAIANVLGEAVERERADAALRAANQRAIKEYELLLERLAGLAQEVGTAADLRTIYRALLNFAQLSAPCSGMLVSTYDAERQERTCVFAWSPAGEDDVSGMPVMPMTQSPHSRAVATGEIVVSNNLSADLVGQPIFDLGGNVNPQRPESALVVPMKILGRVIGALEIQALAAAAYRAEHTTAMRMAANLAAIATENVRLLQREREARLAIQASEERFRDLFENANDVVYTHDLYGNFTSVNRAGQVLSGYSREEFLALSVAEIVTPAHADRLQKMLATVIRKRRRPGEQRHSSQEVSILTKDGTEVALEVNTWFTFRDGRAAGVQGIARDIRQRQQREREWTAIAAISTALRNVRTRSDVAEAVLDQVIELLQVHGATLTLHALGQPDLIIQVGRGAWSLLTGKQIPAGSGLSWHVMASGKPYLNDDIRRDPRLTLEPDLLQGVYAVAAIPLMARQQAIGVLWVGRQTPLRDEEVHLLAAIAELVASALFRATLHEQLQAQAEQVQQIIDTLPEGLLLLADDYRLVLANPAARTHLPLLLPEPAEAAAVAGGRQPLAKLGGWPVKRLLEPPPPGQLYHELTVERANAPQTPVIFEAIARSVTTGPQSDGWVLIIRDVTRERQLQLHVQHQERLAAVGQLAAGIAHDFNNIMSVIVLYAQMVQQARYLAEKDGQRLNVIHQQAIHATNLIHQILDFSRRSVMSRNPMNLLPFIKEMIRLWQRTFPENIKLRLQHQEQEYIVHGDPTRLQQMLMNLAFNARDAMPQGGTLCFSLQRLRLAPGAEQPLPDMAAGSWLKLVVSDTGIGIAPQHMPHLFEPFFTTKAPGQGTGLGLSQVYGIIKQHEGHIVVESVAGAGPDNGSTSGATFVIYLPLLADETAAPSLPGLAELPESGAGTILIVEDNDSARRALEDVLVSLGYRVLLAADGREAIEIYQAEAAEIDLIISDLIMPHVGGAELYRILKQQQPQLKMIVLTGYPLADQGKELLEQGVVGWLQKPFGADEIALKVRVALEQQR
jgi:two-component system, cell cycle sensor histidine kinase and response regulator CckA